MRIRQWIIASLALIAFFTGIPTFAQEINNLGQVLKIRFNVQRFIGKPSWLIIIRDVDHNQNIPYLFDITRNEDYWVAMTYGRDYYVVASELALNPFDRTIRNFCGLESTGSILRGMSMDIIVTGRITKNPDTVTCNVMRYSDPNFSFTPQD